MRSPRYRTSFTDCYPDFWWGLNSLYLHFNTRDSIATRSKMPQDSKVTYLQFS